METSVEHHLTALSPLEIGLFFCRSIEKDLEANVNFALPSKPKNGIITLVKPYNCPHRPRAFFMVALIGGLIGRECW
jgi:hypothetical protein